MSNNKIKRYDSGVSGMMPNPSPTGEYIEVSEIAAGLVSLESALGALKYFNARGLLDSDVAFLESLIGALRP